MKFSLVTLYVNDMEKSLRFYGELLTMPVVRRQPIGDGKELVFLGEEGNVSLELIPSDTKTDYSGFSIGFDVDDMETVTSRLLAEGYGIIREFSPRPSMKLCFFNGPNGEEVELIETRS